MSIINTGYKDKEEAKNIFVNIRDPLENEKVFDAFLLKNQTASAYLRFYSCVKEPSSHTSYWEGERWQRGFTGRVMI